MLYWKKDAEDETKNPSTNGGTRKIGICISSGRPDFGIGDRPLEERDEKETEYLAQVRQPGACRYQAKLGNHPKPLL